MKKNIYFRKIINLKKKQKCVLKFEQLTSNLSERGIFCCATWTPCGTTAWLSGDATDDGSGPNNAGTKCPGAK